MRLKRDLSDYASCFGGWGLQEPARRIGNLSAVANILIVQPEALFSLLTGGSLPLLGGHGGVAGGAAGAGAGAAGEAYREGLRWVELRADYRKGDLGVWRTLTEHPAAKGR